MTLVSLLVVLVAVGVVLYVINTYVPMDGKIKNLMNVAVILIMVVWLLEKTSILGTLSSIKI